MKDFVSLTFTQQHLVIRMSALLGQRVEKDLRTLISIEALFGVTKKLIEGCRLTLQKVIAQLASILKD